MRVQTTGRFIALGSRSRGPEGKTHSQACRKRNKRSHARKLRRTAP